jgi:hypothetical protein
MSRPRVYGSDKERLQAWRERKRQEEQECKEQRPLEKRTQEYNESASRRQLEQAVERLEFIGEYMVMKGYCSPAEATDMQVLVRVAVREPGHFEKWRRERALTALRGLVPWHEE